MKTPARIRDSASRTRIIFQCEPRQLAKYERAAWHRDLTLSAWIRHVLDGASIAFAEKSAKKGRK